MIWRYLENKKGFAHKFKVSILSLCIMITKTDQNWIESFINWMTAVHMLWLFCHYEGEQLRCVLNQFNLSWYLCWQSNTTHIILSHNQENLHLQQMFRMSCYLLFIFPPEFFSFINDVQTLFVLAINPKRLIPYDQQLLLMINWVLYVWCVFKIVWFKMITFINQELG